MVPKQENLGQADSSDIKSESPQFGSQMVDENSTTPYTDATQVCANLFYGFNIFFHNFLKK
jgi:hypothetical protein